MKFKEIKPGMVIHCPTEDNAKVLLEYLHEMGYSYRFNLIDWIDKYTCYVIDTTDKDVMRSTKNLFTASVITEFSDLIEPDDSPMNAEEIIRWLWDADEDTLRNIFGQGYTNLQVIFDAYEPEEILQKIEQYEAAKKAPKPVEVKEGYHCCVYRDTGLPINEYILWDVDEQAAKDDAIDKAMQYTKENGELAYAAVDFVCHVKEDE